MILGIDIGNTNIVCAKLESRGHDGVGVHDINRYRTGEELPDFSVYSGVTHIYVCSVVPDVDLKIRQLCIDGLGITPVFVNHQHVTPYYKIVSTVPEQFGADRLMTVLGARMTNDYSGGLILVDLGTATKFEAINAAGDYEGGAICVGPELASQALHLRTAKLPHIDMEKPSCVIGTCTIDAIQSGLYYGYLGMIDGLIGRFQEKLGGKAKVIVSGGLAETFGDDLKGIDKLDRNLTLLGLYYIYKDENRNA